MSTQKKIYELVKRRGVIPDIPLERLNYLFLDKLQEEANELIMDVYKKGYVSKQEIADCYIVICNMAYANQIDIEDAALEKANNDIARK